MKMKQTSILFFIVLILSGCSKNTIIDEPRQEIDEGIENLFNYEVNETKVLVWHPDMYASTNDVRIETADTTIISISKSFYERLEHKVGMESILNIILTNNDVPFIRKVGFVDPRGDRYYMETEQATIEEMFKNLDVEMSTEPFFSEETATRAGSRAAGFVDGQGIVHPTKYIIEYPDGTKEIMDGRDCATRFSASLDLRLEFPFDKEFTVPHTPDWFNMGIGVQGKVYAYTHLGINIGWFKLNKFEAKLGGGIELDMPIWMEVETDLFKKFETDIDVMKGPRISALIWIGAIPISVGVTPKLNFEASLGARAQARCEYGFNYNMAFETGVVFERNKGWRPIRKFNQDFNTRDFTASAGVEVSGKAGLYAKLALDIYSIESIYAKIGAYTSALAGAEISYNPNELTINYHADWGVEAGLGAHVKVLNYKLAEWSTEFNIYGPKVICDYEKTYPF
ncbi:hypothetical protein [Bacteroides sp. 519]|uniref:hypothetical protein n=1 Tax=Bacteroides sp. 519 TaxID=2302937 RepID=UPI0013D332BF|nr:hypothetical protein [Bacteroides sp. 519]NDV56931.1 hypothetical protein [Bacteroides sp. 519]